MTASPYLTAAEAAVYLRCSPRTLKAWASAGEIPHRKLAAGTSSLLFLEDELREWVDRGVELETIATANGGRVVRPKP